MTQAVAFPEKGGGMGARGLRPVQMRMKRVWAACPPVQGHRFK